MDDFGPLNALYNVPDINDALDNTPLPQMQKRKGMFGGGVSIDPGAFLAAFAAGLGNPAGMQALQNLQQRRLLAQRQALEQQQYQRQRQDKRDDFMFERDYNIAHPLPGQPGEFEDTLMQSGIQPGTPEWTQAMVTRRQNMLDPVVMTVQGPMLRSQLIGGGQPAPQGVTFTPIGGPSPKGSGGFLGF